tara:strand:- start:453 stop:1517 length:1065 start_codon:yes stop_codon:yes gene_type:complete
MILKKIKINKITLQNRIVVGPMCQYSANNGKPSKWHFNHLKKLSKLGAGLLMIESTAVSKSARISNKDLQLSNASQQASFFKLLKHLKKNNNIAIGIQISHAGRKGSAKIPWIKSNSPLRKKDGSWQTYAPSEIKRDLNWPKPEALTKTNLELIIKDFKSTTIRAKKIGFDCLEIHMGHGYLLHQFISSISNKRTDKFGGSLKNRCKYPLEIFKQVRKIWPKNRILGVRITGSDHLKNGIKVNDSIYLAKQLKNLKADYVAVTSGGILPKTGMRVHLGHRVNLAKKIRKKTKIRVIALGMMNSVKLINRVFSKKEADLVAVSRRFVNEPYWLIKEYIKSEKKHHLLPEQYLRCF